MFSKFFGRSGKDSTYVRVRAGSFTMGSGFSEWGRMSWEPEHRVTITHEFEIKSRLVTNREYALAAQWAVDHEQARICGDGIYDENGTAKLKLLDFSAGMSELGQSGSKVAVARAECPVRGVTWCGAAAYCNWLSLMNDLRCFYNRSNWAGAAEGIYGISGYRLPTSAEWEYACRAGSTTSFANGNQLSPDNPQFSRRDPKLDAIGWFCENSGGTTHEVASKIANAWGLYDMHGNVAEWCNDYRGEFDDASPWGGSDDTTDPVGPELGESRVVRGGAWNDWSVSCRSANQASCDPAEALDCVGLRPIRIVT